MPKVTMDSFREEIGQAANTVIDALQAARLDPVSDRALAMGCLVVGVLAAFRSDPTDAPTFVRDMFEDAMRHATRPPMRPVFMGREQ